MRKIKFGSILIIGLLVSGCAIRETNLKRYDNQRPPTAVERATILNSIRNSFFDPYSIRDAEISNSAPTYLSETENYSNICVKTNSKNRMIAVHISSASSSRSYGTG